MRPADLFGAVAAIRAGNWGERRTSLEFFLEYPYSYPFVADADGTVVGTAIATQNGNVGWVGLVFVSPAFRGRGLGRDLTRATLRCFEELGCTSVVLAATELGQPVYERLGFRSEGSYVIFDGAGRSQPITDHRLRAMTSADVPAVAALDQEASAEDRTHLIEAATSGWVLDDGQAIRGYALRTAWGRGPAIAPDPVDGKLLFEVLRAQASAGHLPLATIVQNPFALDHLRTLGFAEGRHLPRMVLGNPVSWQPEHIWAMFSFALG